MSHYIIFISTHLFIPFRFKHSAKTFFLIAFNIISFMTLCKFNSVEKLRVILNTLITIDIKQNISV